MIALAVDAQRLTSDRTARGRFVRALTAALSKHRDVRLTLLGTPGSAVRTARKRNRYDAVWFPYDGLTFPARAPAVIALSDDAIFGRPGDGPLRRLRAYRRRRVMLRQAAAVTTFSEAARLRVTQKHRIDPARVIVLPHAAPPAFTPGFEPAPFDEPFILAFAGSDQRESVPLVLRAAAAAFPNGDVRLAVVGRLSARLQSAVRRGGIPIAEFAEADDDLLRRLYRTAAVVALPSGGIESGMLAAEAQACGCPVLAVRGTDAGRVATDGGGVVVDSLEPARWSDALRDAVDHEGTAADERARSATRRAIDARDAAAAALLAAVAAARGLPAL